MRGVPTESPIANATIAAARAADDKKATDTVVLAVGDILGITEYFVIASASNPRLARTIAEEVEQQLKDECERAPRAIEGLDDLRWVLMDYGDFVVHVFLDEAREFYSLDRLWADAPRVEWRVPGRESAAG